MSGASEVLGGIVFSRGPSGYREADGTNALCFRDELWRLKGWPYEEGPEWDRFPDWILDDLPAVVEAAGLVHVPWGGDGAYERLRQEFHPGLAMFQLKQRSDGVEAHHVEYVNSVALIGRVWDASGQLADEYGPCWPLRPEYLPRFDARLVAVFVDETQQPHGQKRDRYRPEAP
ncbi:hypothetical protein ACFW1A_23845 [Kitasatospora sp. NPDC058965]|uniref:hypothetical protein n=1 Tax=Kitasatospora sp. NPDC058965 TaxID=3346682 RepID=UPI00369DD601